MRILLITLFLLFDITRTFAATPSDADRQKAINDALINVESNLNSNPSIVRNTFNSTNQVEPQNQPRVHKKGFEFGFEEESYDYRTGDKWPPAYSLRFPVSDKVTRDGYLYGLHGSSTWVGPLQTWKDFLKHDKAPNFAKLEIEASKGNTDYESYVTGKLKGLKNWNLDGRVMIGYDYMCTPSTDVAPFIGIGYQRKSNNAGDWVDYNVDSYYRFTTITEMAYVPFGIETHTKLNERWDFDVNLEGDIIVFGRDEYHLNEVPGPIQGTYNGNPILIFIQRSDSTLNGGIGFRAHIKLIRKYKYFNLYVEPFFKFLYLNQNQEEPIKAIGTDGTDYVSLASALWTPKNTTVDLGAQAGVQF